jgi:hypothetical protein
VHTVLPGWADWLEQTADESSNGEEITAVHTRIIPFPEAGVPLTQHLTGAKLGVLVRPESVMSAKTGDAQTKASSAGPISKLWTLTSRQTGPRRGPALYAARWVGSGRSGTASLPRCI